jgi:hypothetical protein
MVLHRGVEPRYDVYKTPAADRLAYGAWYPMMESNHPELRYQRSAYYRFAYRAGVTYGIRTRSCTGSQPAA